MNGYFNVTKADWTKEQGARTDEFQRELQKKSEAMSDLSTEKVITSYVLS